MSALLTPGLSRLRVPGSSAGVSAHTLTPPADTPGTVNPLTAEARQQSLQKLLVEDLSWLPIPWLPQQFDRDDGFGWGVANGSTSDRKSGRNTPLFWSEVDLRGYRVLSRHLCESNFFGIGFLQLLTNSHVRKGYGWQACRKGAAKGAYQTVGAAADPLVEKGQRILDTWRDENQWPAKSREAFRRSRRDGEVFGRFGSAGWGELPWFRFVDPSQVGHPRGETDGPESYGLAKRGGDTAGPTLAYHLWSVENPGRGEWIDAEWILHAKVNVDSDVKRGLPDFFPVAEALETTQTLLHTMLATALKQARVAWREKFPTASFEQVRALVPATAAQTYPSSAAGPDVLPNRPWGPGRPDTYTSNQFRRADVVKVEGNREYEPGPTYAGAANYIAVEQAVLRGCGVRWQFPEYFSGDASNNNMASAFVANSPFVTAVECSQEEWAAQWERPVALKVLELARDAGLLSWEEWAALDVETTAAAVATPEPDKDATRVGQLIDKKVMCLDTARQQLGLDPQHEAEGVKKDQASAAPPPQPGAPPGNTPPGNPPGGDIFGESRVSEEGPPPFPGAVFDKGKHRWVKGAAAAPDAQTGSTASPAPTPDEHAKRAARGERRHKDAVAASAWEHTAKERPRPKAVEAANAYRDCARRRRVIAAVKNEGELAEAIGGHNLPDSEPADVVHITDAAGKPVTDPYAVKGFLQQRADAVKALATGTHPTAGRPLTPEERSGYEARLGLPVHFFEVKTLLTSAKDQVYMNPRALKRKQRWAKKYFVEFHVVAVDGRRGGKFSGHRVYVMPNALSDDMSGTVKLADMTKAASLAHVAKEVGA